VQKAVSTSNIVKAGKFIKDIIYREDAEEMSQRDVEYEDLSTREPSINSFFSPKKKAATNSNSEEIVGREDDDVFKQHFADYEVD